MLLRSDFGGRDQSGTVKIAHGGHRIARILKPLDSRPQSGGSRVRIGALLPGRLQNLVHGSALNHGSPLNLIVGKRDFMSLVRIDPVRKTADGKAATACRMGVAQGPVFSLSGAGKMKETKGMAVHHQVHSRDGALRTPGLQDGPLPADPGLLTEYTTCLLQTGILDRDGDRKSVV